MPTPHMHGNERDADKDGEHNQGGGHGNAPRDVTSSDQAFGLTCNHVRLET